MKVGIAVTLWAPAVSVQTSTSTCNLSMHCIFFILYKFDEANMYLSFCNMLQDALCELPWGRLLLGTCLKVHQQMEQFFCRDRTCWINGLSLMKLWSWRTIIRETLKKLNPPFRAEVNHYKLAFSCLQLYWVKTWIQTKCMVECWILHYIKREDNLQQSVHRQGQLWQRS